MPPLDIVFEDENLLVINKPSGFATHAPLGIKSVEILVRDYLQQKAPPGDPVYVGIPHRLDRPASGAIVFAKVRSAARKLSRQFERRRVRKTYWAAVHGVVEPGEGTWTDFLCKVPDLARVEVVTADYPGAQQAILHYRTLSLTPHGALLEIDLHTGRMHQIRVQAATRGWPIVGDLQYGSPTPFGPPTDDPRRRSIALHARSISLTPPGCEQPRTFTAPLGESWHALGVTDSIPAQ